MGLVSVDEPIYPPLKLTTIRSLVDPSPEHMNVAGNADDFFCTPDLSSVTFESPMDRPLGSIDFNAAASAGPSHRRSGSSRDASEGSYYEGGNMSCLPTFRRQKVMSADVASVGNASDTLVVIGELGGKMSGRDLHEKAKAVLNAGNYDQAIVMFEAIEKAQRNRFGDVHPSVGAATHNVAVVRLRMGQADVAEELFEQAVAIRRKVLGDEHLDLAVRAAQKGSGKDYIVAKGCALTFDSFFSLGIAGKTRIRTSGAAKVRRWPSCPS